MKSSFAQKCALAVVALSLSGVAFAGDFSQADLEKMVKELEVFSTKFPDYVYPIQCSVVTKDEKNAYATVEKTSAGKWQGKMVVYTGFVKFVNEDLRLIRACVAHEISHLAKGHCTMPGWKPSDLNNLWTRQQEYEADIVGASLLQKAGYSKNDMADLMLKLDELDHGSWLGKLTGDHASGKSRAAEVSDNPLVMKSLMDFEVGLAFMEARSYNLAMQAFDRAILKEPKFGESYTNSAQAAVMFYYDNLPKDIKAAWMKPDFGPMLAPPPVGAKDPFIRDEDRSRWEAARVRIAAAIMKNKDDLRVLELASLILVLDPDARPNNLKAGTEGLKTLTSTAVLPSDKLRLANNASLGMQRMGQLKDAVEYLVKAQVGITLFNPFLAENLGTHDVPAGDKDQNILAASILGTWLDNTAQAHPAYDKVKKNYLALCAANSLKVMTFTTRPIYLSKVMSLSDGGSELGMFEPYDKFATVLGKPAAATRYDDRYPDLMEVRWRDGNLTVLTERDAIVRVTSYSLGAFLTLKSQDTTLDWEAKIVVGMKKSDFEKVLNPEKALKVSLIKTGSIEEWTYWPGLNMGVLFKDDVVAGITATPAR